MYDICLFLPSLLSMIISRYIYVAVNDIVSYFLWLSNILLYIYNIPLAYIWYIYIYAHVYHIFFIHSSVDGHLGCVCVLIIVNSAAMNVGTRVSS